MPNKKGSRVAASRAKSQQKAKKKATRSTGSGVPAAAQVPATPATDEELEQPDAVEMTAEPTEAAAQPAPAPARREARRGAAAARRERQAHALVAGVSLKREVSLIAAITAAAGVALAVLKLATDLGA